MVHLEQAQPEQLQELLAFAEEAFRTPEGKVDFPTLLPKLYGPGADSAPLHTVLYEDGAPAGLYCLKIQDFNIAGTALRVGGIGTVCVDGRSRGKGHLALLMQDAQERMQAAGCDIAMLGGQRQRYERFGYVPAGAHWEFTLTPRNVRDIRTGGVALALLCLCFVLPLLMAADDGFASLLSGFVGRLAAWFSGWRDSWTEFVVKVFFALPTALYLYGLVYGAVRGRRACVYDKKEVCAVQRGLRFAPRSTVLTALFVLCAVYLLFISMQAKYLFGAFWGALPEGFSYSEYARQGFFELCRVAAINIVLLLAANVMSRAQAAENCLLRVCNTALSALTLLLLATAAAKMALYIAAYGLTVKRVLASVFLVWMACVFVCVILRQFRTVALVRVAVFLGAVLFALLCVLPVGDGISTYNAARVQAGTLDPDVMEQELRPLV
ncbi:MAG: GNAT family N-acetyltransferase [Ruthenibacterium lactatiformans]|nr:GNAT family N-acetyltransferase [Ruthenibacterium lactatiformans]